MFSIGSFVYVHIPPMFITDGKNCLVNTLPGIITAYPYSYGLPVQKFQFAKYEGPHAQLRQYPLLRCPII